MNRQYIHVVERRVDGFAPPMSTIRRVLRIAASKGFRSDWNYCGILESGALSFGDISADDGVSLIAVKLSGEYRFVTDSEYLDLKLPSDVRRCAECGQPVKPGRHKPGEYEHAQGCPNAPRKRGETNVQH